MDEDAFVDDSNLWMHSWEKLYLDPKSADVRFLFSNPDHPEEVPEVIAAHKMILCSCCPVFDTMFNGPLKESGDIVIKDSSAKAFKEFLQFFYLGNVELTVENSVDVLNLCKKYGMSECLKACEAALKKLLTINELCWGYGIANFYELEDLAKFCGTKIKENAHEILTTESFLQCNAELLTKILKLMSLEQLSNELLQSLDQSAHSTSSVQEILASAQPNLLNQIKNALSVVSPITSPDLICDRRPERREVTGHMDSISDSNSCCFSPNHRLLLKEFVCTQLHSNRKNQMSMDYTIFYLPTLRPLISGSLKLAVRADTQVVLPQPVLLEKDKSYAIRFQNRVKDAGHSAILEELKSEVELEEEIAIRFWSESYMVARLVFQKPECAYECEDDKMQIEIINKEDQQFAVVDVSDWVHQRNEKLYLDKITADVHFIFSNTSGPSETIVPAHKLILSIICRTFDALFKSMPGGSDTIPTIPVDDLSADAFKEFLQFFYLTKVRLTSKNAIEVMTICQKYEMAVCLEICENIFKSSVCIHNVCSMYRLALSNSLERLADFCEKTIVENARKVLYSEGILECDHEFLLKILRLLSETCDSTELVHSSVAWANQRCKRNNLERNSANIRAELGEIFNHSPFHEKILNKESLEKSVETIVSNLSEAEAAPTLDFVCDRRIPGDLRYKSTSENCVDFFDTNESILITGFHCTRLSPAADGKPRSMEVKYSVTHLPDFETKATGVVLLSSNEEAHAIFDEPVYTDDRYINAICLQSTDEGFSYISVPLRKTVRLEGEFEVNFRLESEMITQVDFQHRS